MPLPTAGTPVKMEANIPMGELVIIGYILGFVMCTLGTDWFLNI